MYNRRNIEFERAEIVDFWSKTMSEHSAFIAHLLDPTEGLLIDQAIKLENAFANPAAIRRTHVRREAVRLIDELKRARA